MNGQTSDVKSLAECLRQRLRGMSEAAKRLERVVERQLEELARKDIGSRPAEAGARSSASNGETLWYRYPEKTSI
jgi:hypothetical protein